MNPAEMITHNFAVEIVGDPSPAPKYHDGETKMLKIKKAIIVGKGTVGGNPTVDLQVVDDEGKKYLIMVTGNLVELLGQLTKSKREQDSGAVNGNPY